MIIISIIAVLATLSFGYYTDALEDARANTRITNIKMLNEAINGYYRDHSDYPMYKDFEVSMKAYLSKNASVILKEAQTSPNDDIYYRVRTPMKAGDAKDAFGNGGISVDVDISGASNWQNAEEISVHTRKDDLRIVEVFVGEYRPQ